MSDILGSNLLGNVNNPGGSTSYMHNLFGSRYRGYGTTEVGDAGTTQGGIPSIKGGLGRSQSVMEMYLAVTQVTNERDKIYQALLDVEDYSIVQTIIEIMRDDVLSPDESSKEIFTISSMNEQYDSILKGMEKRLELDSLVQDFMGDLLLFGEYPFKVTTEPNKGVVSLDEVASPTDITPIYKGRKVSRYLVRQQSQDSLIYSSSEFTSLSPYDFITFLRYPRKVRLNTKEKYPFLIDGMVKLGRSIFPLETLERIKSLYLLEKMLPLARVLQMNRSTVVGVQLGQTLMTKAVIEACREYERYLNSGVSSTSYLDVNAVINSVGKFKVVPILGDKGSIVEQKLDNFESIDNAMKDIIEIRNAIVSSVGLLPSYVFEGDKQVHESLRTYIRYLRKLDSAQQCIVHGLKHLGLIELYSRGITDAVLSDVNVTFANNISLANIEKLEFLDILVSLLGNYTTFINTLSQDPSTTGFIDKVQMLSFIKRKLSYLHGAEEAISIRDDNAEEDQENSDSKQMTEDLADIDAIIKGLPKNVRSEINNNIIKINREIGPKMS